MSKIPDSTRKFEDGSTYVNYTLRDTDNNGKFDMFIVDQVSTSTSANKKTTQFVSTVYYNVKFEKMNLSFKNSYTPAETKKFANPEIEIKKVAGYTEPQIVQPLPPLLSNKKPITSFNYPYDKHFSRIGAIPNY